MKRKMKSKRIHIRSTKSKKLKRDRYLILFVMASLAAILLFGLILTIGRIVEGLSGNGTKHIEYANSSVEKPKINKEYLTPNINSRPGTTLTQVNAIVIHYTANPGTSAMANRNYFESRKDASDRSENKVSSHFVIGIDGKVIQCIPLNEIAYASNQRNADSISIECCHPSPSGKFSKATYRSLVQLGAWLCAKYQIPQKDIIRHYDVTGKLCPKYYVLHEGAWEQLKQDIVRKIQE